MLKQKTTIALVLVICVLASVTAANAADVEKITLSDEMLDYIAEQCELRGVEPELALAVIRVESTFRPNAVNVYGNCFGLMQVNKINLKWLKNDIGTTDLLDPYQNVEAGIYMLSCYLKEYEDVHAVLMVYNYGESGAKKQWRNGYTSSRYSRKVMGFREDYIEQGVFKVEEEPKTAGVSTVAPEVKPVEVKPTVRFIEPGTKHTCVLNPKNTDSIHFAA